DLKDNRLHLVQRVSGAGFEGHNTVVIKAGEGTTYDHRARTATPTPRSRRRNNSSFNTIGGFRT
ncbi:MAG: hypothetical protein ACXW16_09025, partial [Burkholderiaceae bacterium]